MSVKVAKVYQSVATPTTGSPSESRIHVVSLSQVPRWGEVVYSSSVSYDNEEPLLSTSDSADPLTSITSVASTRYRMPSMFPVDHEINSKIYIWRGVPWNLEVDAVVNSTNEVIFTNFFDKYISFYECFYFSIKCAIPHSLVADHAKYLS